MTTTTATAATSSSGASPISSSHVAAITDFPLKGHQLTLRWGLGAAALGNKVYVFGGYLWSQGAEAFFNDFYELDLATCGIRRVTVDGLSPCPRFGHSMAADPATQQVFLFGGRSTSESYADFWSFDPAKQTWTLLSGPQYRRGKKKYDKLDSSTTASKNSDNNNNNGSSSCHHHHGGPEARSWQSLSVWNGSAYIYGGWDHNNRVFNDLWAFDIGALSWTRLEAVDTISCPPHGRSCHQAAVWNDHLYVFGGLRDGDAPISDMWRYSLESRLWFPVEYRGIRPGGRTSAASAVIENSWIVHGGLADFPRAGVVAQDSVIEFNFHSSTWVSRTVVLSETARSGANRYGHVAVALPSSFAVLLLGGAERYASACTLLSCRLDLLPSQSQVADLAAELLAASRLAQLNRDRVGDIVDVVQNYDSQLRALKAENAALAERLATALEQLAQQHQQYTSLQAAMAAMQQTLNNVEQVVPMMRSIGTAIASIGNAAAWPAGSGSGSAPTSSASLAGPRAFGSLASSGDLRFGKE